MGDTTYIFLKDIRQRPVVFNNTNTIINNITNGQLYNLVVKRILNDDCAIEYKYYKNKFVIQLNGKLLHKDSHIPAELRPGINNIEWHIRIKGGFINDVKNFVLGLLRIFLVIPKVVLWVGAIILWSTKVFYFLVVWAIKYFKDNGLVGLIKFLVIEILLAPVHLIYNLAKQFVNWIARYTVQAIWGVDNVPDNINQTGAGQNNDNPETNNCTGTKCYKTADGTVPFSVIIVTILCPPIGVFLEYGLTGWFNILITAILTLLFYFPGLIYALILLYC